jgi:hypothetical protein
MKSLFTSTLLILFATSCCAQYSDKEQFLNDYWKSYKSKDSFAYRSTNYPKFYEYDTSAIHQGFDSYLSSKEVSIMLKRAQTDTLKLLWDQTKVEGITFISNSDAHIISNGPCGQLEGKELKDTSLVRRAAAREKVMKKYHNPSGVYYYPLPIYDETMEYAIFGPSYYCCGFLCMDTYCYLFKKVNGHWTTIAKAYLAVH